MSTRPIFMNTPGKHLILASQSQTRVKLLSNAGLIFDTMKPGVDEDAIKTALLAEGASPEDLAVLLAKFKAERVSAQHPNALVIGADQVLSFEGTIVSKVRTREAAKEKLKTLAGHRHHLITGQIVARGGQEIWRNVDTARLTMRPFSDAFIDTYLDAAGDDILSSVGCYHVEGLGAQLFSDILGDWTTIQGLTILPLVNFLREHSVVGT